MSEKLYREVMQDAGIPESRFQDTQRALSILHSAVCKMDSETFRKFTNMHRNPALVQEGLLEMLQVFGVSEDLRSDFYFSHV